MISNSHLLLLTGDFLHIFACKACFPSAVPPSSASFSAFIRKNARTTSDEVDFASKPIQVVGESKKLEYLSTDELENGGPGCKYACVLVFLKVSIVLR